MEWNRLRKIEAARDVSFVVEIVCFIRLSVSCPKSSQWKILPPSTFISDIFGQIYFVLIFLFWFLFATDLIFDWMNRWTQQNFNVDDQNKRINNTNRINVTLSTIPVMPAAQIPQALHHLDKENKHEVEKKNSISTGLQSTGKFRCPKSFNL